MTDFLRYYSRPVRLFLLLVGTAVFLFSLFTLWRFDAVGYQYICSYDEVGCNIKEPVRNLADIWKSQVVHYNTTNGRFVVHVIVQLFCGILGTGVFSFFNACIWMIMPLMMLGVAGEKRPSLKSVITAAVLATIVFYQLRFDPPMQINYVWTGVAILLWVKLFLTEKSANWWQILLLAIYSFLIGEGNESFSAPVSVGIIAFFIWHRGKFTPRQWAMALAFGAGAILLVIAPGIWARSAAEATPHSLSQLLRGIAMILPVPLLVAATVWLCKTIRKSVFSRGQYIFMGVVALINYLLAVYLYRAAIERVSICGALFLTVILLSKLRDFSYRSGTLTVVSCLAALLLSSTIYDTWRCNRVEEEIYDAYGKSADGVAYIPDDEYGYQSNELRLTDVMHVGIARKLHPGKPDAVVRPAAMRNLPLDKDTNLVVKIAPQTWLMLRSKTHPANFVINKRLLPGIVNATMAPRELNFGEGGDVVFEESELWQAAVYNNARPFMESDVTMVLPR